MVNTSVPLQDGVQGAVGGLGAATGGLGAAVGGAPPPLLPLHNSGMNNVGAGAGSSALQSQAVAQLSSQLAAQTLNTVQVTGLGDVVSKKCPSFGTNPFVTIILVSGPDGVS